MQKQVTLTVNVDDIGRIIEALRIRAEAWNQTAAYLLSGDPPENIIVEETDDATEARAIASEYARIATLMDLQFQ